MSLPTICNLIFEANLTNTDTQPLLLGTVDSIFQASRSFQTSPRQWQVSLGTALFAGTTGTAGYFWSAADFYDKVLLAQHDNYPQYWIGSTTATAVLPGLNQNANEYSDSPDGSALFDGVTSFFSHVVLWKGATLKWSDLDDFTNYIPIGATTSSATLTVASNFTQPAVGSTVVVTTTEDPTAGGTLLTVGQFVRVDDPGTPAFYNFYSVTAISSGPNHVTLKLLGTTGHTVVGGTIVATTRFIQTLDANEAGEVINGGALINGDIWQVVPMGDYAYIFKEWSIQSVQYVGFGNGIFYAHTEVVREGLLGRNSIKNLGNGNIIFLGHRELYSYSGAGVPATPVCRQYTRQLYGELDRTKLDQIFIAHRESRNEVWVVYPVSGGLKVLIWNYVEDTATLDVYDSVLMGLTAVQEVGWDSDPSWVSLAPTLTWANFDPTATWASLVSSGKQQVALLATGSLDLIVHGLVFNRDGAAYESLAETMDYDFGDRAIFKYIDVVNVGLMVLQNDNVTRNLYIQVGYRTSLDDDITWTTAKAIPVQGNANFTAKVNPGGAGRFIRLRFYSQDADVQWRVSSFEIYARAGGTF